MPSHVSDIEETRCLAFTKDHRRCRLQREDESNTCPYHKDYFSRWLETHEGFHSVHSSKREIEEYKFQIINKHVHIPEYYISKLSLFDYEYYNFLIRHTKHSAVANRDLLMYSVHSLGFTIFISKRHKAAKEYCKKLFPLFTDPISILICFQGLWHEMVKTYRSYTDEETQYMTRFRNVFFSPMWRPIVLNSNLWYAIETVWELVLRNEEEIARHLNLESRYIEQWSRERFQDMLYEMIVYHQKKMKERIQPFKEELMAAAWHPKRVEKWITMYGLESIDDM